jgi:hypothetical protein
MNIDFKEGVPVTGLSAMTYQAIFICAQVFNKYNKPLTVTSTTDGEHIENSFHYIGDAFDIRTRRLPFQTQLKLMNECKRELKKLSRCFQVVLEETHIHVEFDWR